MTGALSLSDRGTLIVPVQLSELGFVAESPTLALGRLSLTRKREHHLTVLGYSIGKHVKKAVMADASLAEDLNELIRTFDFTMRLGDRVFHLVQVNDKGRLDTVIVTAEADLAGFFAAAQALLLARGISDGPLFAGLGAPPPPHVTLYTSDPEGVLGIGLNATEDLASAIARVGTDDVGLRAYRLNHAVL